MAKKNEKELEVQRQEVISSDEMERTRERKCFVPRTDIYETESEIIVLADLPGAAKDNIDIMLEKNVLSISANVNPDIPEGYSLSYGEYEVGDYSRSFRLSNQVDREKIEAVVTDGVLKLILPKAEEAKVKKIAVSAGR